MRGPGGGCLRWYLTKILREMVPREAGDRRLPASAREGTGEALEEGTGSAEALGKD